MQFITVDIFVSFTALSSSRRLSFEEDSFTKFTIDMMKQYMQEEEIRAQHQVDHLFYSTTLDVIPRSTFSSSLQRLYLLCSAIAQS